MSEWLEITNRQAAKNRIEDEIELRGIKITTTIEMQISLEVMIKTYPPPFGYLPF